MRWSPGVIVLAVTSCGGRADTPPATQSSGTPPAPAIADRRPRVVIIGTSLTAGYGLDDPDEAYPAVLQRIADSAGLAYRVVNAGLSGETSAGALRRTEWLLRDPAAVVIVETGANDGLRGLDPDSTAANLSAIVGVVRARLPGARVVLVQMEAPPNLGIAYTERFQKLFPAVARETGAMLMPFLLAGVAGDARLNQPDGIHPTAEGARLVAANVWRTVEPLLEDRRAKGK